MNQRLPCPEPVTWLRLSDLQDCGPCGAFRHTGQCHRQLVVQFNVFVIFSVAAVSPRLGRSERPLRDPLDQFPRLTAWSLKLAEYEHQFKTIDEAQKMFMVREIMPKDIKREFLTGPRKFDETMENLKIIVNEMMADDGPTPIDLVNVGTHDAKTTQSDSGHEQRHVIRRRVCHPLERVQGRQRSR